MLTIRRTEIKHVTVEFEFSVRDLVEKFSDEELRAEGLFRDLRDADVARARRLRTEEARARLVCGDDDCQCPCHDTGSRHAVVEDLQETAFWPLIRALLLRHDLAAVQHELETRAWDYGNTTVDFSHIRPRG